MLDEGRVLVVQDQFLQGAVQVVRFSEAEAGGGFVDDAMLDLAVHTAGRTDIINLLVPPFFYWLLKTSLGGISPPSPPY